jgi:hypothetical protein
MFLFIIVYIVKYRKRRLSPEVIKIEDDDDDEKTTPNMNFEKE